MGLAGVIPYLVTSFSTVALSFDIQYAAHHGQGLFFSGTTSEQLLHIIEPLQLGYGASVGRSDVNFWKSLIISRSSPSLEPSTGVWNGPSMVVSRVTRDT